MMRADTIVGYVYRADIICPDCISEVLATGPGDPFDGWDIADGAPRMSAEENLSEIAAAFGINRDDESSFDSDYFPKVLFASDDDEAECGRCGEEIG